MKIFSTLLLVATIALLVLSPTTILGQSAAASLASLPDADVLIYVSPQRILNEAAPKFLPAPELAKMRA